MTGAHSLLGASSSHRWMECPGSIQLARGLPNESSIYAKEGNAAHDVAEVCLRNGRDADSMIGEDIVVGNHAFTVDEEMAEAVQVYLDTVRSLMQPGDQLDVERQFSLEYIHADMFGTCAAVIYRPSTGDLFVIDYKHGKGVAVDVVDNPQLKYYGLGAALSEPGRSLNNVTLIVVQPRSPHPDGPVREFHLTSLDLMDFIDDLTKAAMRTFESNAPLKAGDWCKFCPAAGICPELRHESSRAAQMEFDTPGDMSGEDIAAVLEKAELIEDWVRSVKAHAFGLLERGYEVPGFKLVAKRAQRKWLDETGAARHLIGCGLDESELFKSKLKTPAQVEKMLPKDRRGELDEFIIKESSGNTFARNTDKREAVNPDVSGAFNVIDD